MMSMLQKLKDKLVGSHYEFAAPKFAKDQFSECDTIIVQGSFSSNKWQVSTAKKHVENYPSSACCGVDSFITSKTIGHLKSPTGNTDFTNSEIIRLINEAYPDPAKVPTGEQINLHAFLDLSKLCA